MPKCHISYWFFRCDKIWICHELFTVEIDKVVIELCIMDIYIIPLQAFASDMPYLNVSIIEK
jgi:hypothetical protein